MKFEINEDKEKTSRFRTPREGARVWHWAEYDTDTKAYTGNIGKLRAVTEMECIDRLREAWPEIGAFRWVSKDNYEFLGK